MYKVKKEHRHGWRKSLGNPNRGGYKPNLPKRELYNAMPDTDIWHLLPPDVKENLIHKTCIGNLLAKLMVYQCPENSHDAYTICIKQMINNKPLDDSIYWSVASARAIINKQLSITGGRSRPTKMASKIDYIGAISMAKIYY